MCDTKVLSVYDGSTPIAGLASSLLLVFTRSSYSVFAVRPSPTESCDGFALVANGTAMQVTPTQTIQISDIQQMECATIKLKDLDLHPETQGVLALVDKTNILYVITLWYAGGAISFQLSSLMPVPKEIYPVVAISAGVSSFFSTENFYSSGVAVCSYDWVAFGFFNSTWDAVVPIPLQPLDSVSAVRLEFHENNLHDGNSWTVIMTRSIANQGHVRNEIFSVSVDYGDDGSLSTSTIVAPAYFLSEPKNFFSAGDDTDFITTFWTQGHGVVVSHDADSTYVKLVNDWAPDEEWLASRRLFFTYRTFKTDYFILNTQGVVSFSNSTSKLSLFDVSASTSLAVHNVSKPVAQVGSVSTVDTSGKLYAVFGGDGIFDVRCFASENYAKRKQKAKNPKHAADGDCLQTPCDNACCVQQPDFSHQCQLTCSGCTICNTTTNTCASQDCSLKKQK